MLDFDQVLVYAYCDSLPEAYSGRLILKECISTLQQPLYYVGFYSLTFTPLYSELFVILSFSSSLDQLYIVKHPLSLKVIIHDNSATVIRGENIFSSPFTNRVIEQLM